MLTDKGRPAERWLRLSVKNGDRLPGDFKFFIGRDNEKADPAVVALDLTVVVRNRGIAIRIEHDAHGLQALANQSTDQGRILADARSKNHGIQAPHDKRVCTDVFFHPVGENPQGRFGLLVARRDRRFKDPHIVAAGSAEAAYAALAVQQGLDL